MISKDIKKPHLYFFDQPKLFQNERWLEKLALDQLYLLHSPHAFGCNNGYHFEDLIEQRSVRKWKIKTKTNLLIIGTKKNTQCRLFLSHA